jgi:hypothetical protein
MRQIKNVSAPYFGQEKRRGFGNSGQSSDDEPKEFDNYLDESGKAQEEMGAIPNILPPLDFSNIQIIDVA